MLDRRLVVAVLAVLAGAHSSCDSPAAAEPVPSAMADPVVSLSLTRTEKDDASGVGYADCPVGTKLTGGGCKCSSAGANLFAAYPFQDAYFCGCSIAPPLAVGASIYAICVRGAGERAEVKVQSLDPAALQVRLGVELSLLRQQQQAAARAH